MEDMGEHCRLLVVDCVIANDDPFVIILPSHHSVGVDLDSTHYQH